MSRAKASNVIDLASGRSSRECSTPPPPESSRDDAGVLAGSDPHAIAKEFPERWKQFIHAICASPIQCQYMFQVSERTAYRWWTGKGGANGCHVAVAARAHPAMAAAILFSEAA